MIRVSTVVYGSVLAAMFTVSAGCTVQATVKTQSRFVEDNVQQQANEDWNGEDITIDAAGVGLSVNGGMDVSTSSDPNQKRIVATARMLAMADPEDKASADLSITDATSTFRVYKDASGWHVTCGHGGDHGSSKSGQSGCELLTIQLPGGTSAERPLKLTALSGNGQVKINVANATLSNLGVNGKGDIDAYVPTTKGANISVVAKDGNDITLHLPSAFAADSIYLQTVVTKVDTKQFPDLHLTTDANGNSAGSRGEAGTGAASIKATSKRFSDSSEPGAISLVPF